MFRVMTVRLYPNHFQEERLIEYLDVSRRVYNHFLEHRRKAYQRRKEPVTYAHQTAMLTNWRHRDPRIEEIPFAVCREALKRLNRAFQNFFRRCKNGDLQKGYPRFKGKNHWHSFEILQSGNYVQNGHIHVPKLGQIKCRNLRPFIGRARMLRVVRRANRWFAQLLIDDGKSAASPKPIKKQIGIDVGIRSFVAESSGQILVAPRHFQSLEQQLIRASRRVSRRLKGSNNRRKAIGRLQRVHLKIADWRSYFTHKLSKHYAESFDLVAVEKLQIKKMTTGRMAKSILDAAWGQFLGRIRYKAESAGTTFVEVDPIGTSQECSQCGHCVPKSLSVRTHRCSYCGLTICRDVNAARNILLRALETLNGTAGRAETARCKRATPAENPVTGSMKQEVKLGYS